MDVKPCHSSNRILIFFLDIAQNIVIRAFKTPLGAGLHAFTAQNHAEDPIVTGAHKAQNLKNAKLESLSTRTHQTNFPGIFFAFYDSARAFKNKSGFDWIPSFICRGTEAGSQ